MNSRRCIAIALALLPTLLSAQTPIPKGFVYYNENHLLQVRSAIKASNPYFVDRYYKLLEESDSLLTKDADPVVKKS